MVRVCLFLVTILFSINSYSQLKGEVLDHNYYIGIEGYAGLGSTNFNDINSYFDTKYDSKFGGIGVLYGFDFNVRRNYNYISLMYSKYQFDGFDFNKNKFRMKGSATNIQLGYAAFPNEASFDLNTGLMLGVSSLNQTSTDDDGIQQDESASNLSIDCGVFVKPVYRYSNVSMSVNAGYLFDFSGGEWKTDSDKYILPENKFGRLFIQIGVGFYIVTDESFSFESMWNSR